MGGIAGSDRILTLRELNRATLARQLLLARQRLSVARAIERLVALQGQYSPAPYVGLWSRLVDFERRQLESALRRRTVVKTTLFRVTLHLVSARDYSAYAALVTGGRRARLAALAPDLDLEELDRQLRERGPLPLPEVRDLLWPPVEAAGGASLGAWATTRALIPIVHVPPSGLWRNHGTPNVMHAEEWLPPPAVAQEGAAELLVRRYLAAHGPASQADLLKFSGLQARDIKPGFEALELRRFHDERGRVLLDLPRQPLPAADTPAPARFLTKWESAVMGYADRSRVLHPDYQPAVIGPNGEFKPTFTVDGFIHGTWEVKRGRDKATLVLNPFAPIPRRWKEELRAEGERLLRWLEDEAMSFSVKVP